MPDFLEHLAADSARFHAALAEAPADLRVPGCPEWDASDLLWHLAEVQWFWATVVEQRLDTVDHLRPPTRPDQPEELRAFGRAQSARLVRALTEAPAQTPVYMWAADKTVGYIRRRQAHEALIHRLDAEQTVGGVTPLDPELAADGVHEALDVMYGGSPDWGTFAPSGEVVEVRCTDTGDVWRVALGHFTGTDPETGRHDDDPDLTVLDPGPDVSATTRSGGAADTAAVVSGSAEDLDAWLWHRRGADGLTFEGADVVLDRLRAILEQPLD